MTDARFEHFTETCWYATSWLLGLDRSTSFAGMVLALYTFGQFIEPSDDPSNDGFREMNDPVFAFADKAPGLIARSGYAADEGPSPWGEEVYPRFHDDRGDEWSPATLSLWQDIESLYAFTYSGLHAEALKRGREWFRTPNWPQLVL